MTPADRWLDTLDRRCERQEPSLMYDVPLLVRRLRAAMRVVELAKDCEPFGPLPAHLRAELAACDAEWEETK